VKACIVGWGRQALGITQKSAQEAGPTKTLINDNLKTMEESKIPKTYLAAAVKISE